MTLIWDGDCGFCRTWVNYWKTRTGDKVRYVTIAEARDEFPQLPVEQLKQKVHLVTAGGTYAGAEAVFRSLDGVWLTLYQKLPGFAAISELLYGLVARHRDAGMFVTRLLWGDQVVRPDYSMAAVIFVRLLSFIYLVAFASAGLQIRGLIGAEGILPVGPFLQAVQRAIGSSSAWRVPSIFWWGHSDFALLSICWGGVALATVSIITKPFGKFQKPVYAILFFYYLSIVSVGQVFMGYQWDFLLLETGFLAIFLKPQRSRIWLFHFLLFRLMFESGVVKLTSGDPTWRNLTALNFHFQTQPLPTVLAWYAHQLPDWVQRASTLVMLVIELVFPFLIWGPRRMKRVAAFGIAGLQVLILLTGNYTFFNFLTIALCVLLLDNSFWSQWFRVSKLEVNPAHAPATAMLNVAIVFLGAISLGGVFGQLPVSLAAIEAAQSGFGIVNRYGLFAVMTTQRPEIQIEGSLDGEHWLPLRFRYKPGPVERAPRWVAPFQPRLDWQMWFAALAPARQSPWIIPFLLRILEGSKPVLQLLDPGGPFGLNAPKYVRGMVYEYKFTSWAEKRQTGNYWKRELKGMYFPAANLNGR